ncbi:MAG: PepSY domain-containing protein [Gemmatimonadota bacterium]|nr:PepSY domain-containing protein [Gemmatimonadota bacterium]
MFVRKIAPVLALLAIVAVSASAQTPTYKHDLPAKLMKKTKITENAASVSALAKVPNGKIVAVELEQEKGKLIYSYDIKVAGKKGIEEVHVDAIDGTVTGPEHENAASEAAEKKAEAAEKKAKPVKP